MQTSKALKPADRLQQLLPELFNPQPVVGEQFLRLELTPDLTVALALSWIEETLLISPQWVTPMPNMPIHVLGLMSSKSQVFWVINFPQLLGLPVALEVSQYYEVVVIRALPMETMEVSTEGELYLGLVVPKIRGSIRLSLEDIVFPTDEVESNLQPYLSGQVVLDGKPILILSAEAIGKHQLPTTD
ncbi:chemotaxis protein CheW [Leptothoe spongobia]|nr:chemotaxis protein CheW [Leptothoe spongobia]